MKLIPKLKKEHIKILKLLDGIYECSAGRCINDITYISNLNELMEILTTHLNLENKFLYPPFAKSNQPELKSIGKMFFNEMIKIAQETTKFFNKYKKIKVSKLKKDKEFKNKFKQILAKVTKRIEVEEKILFPAYEKYIRK